MQQQQQLAELAQQASQRGIPVLISNHKTPDTDQIYQAAQRHEYFTVRRYISCNGNKRNNAGEVLALFQ
jgi:DNA adenine methylase